LVNIKINLRVVYTLRSARIKLRIFRCSPPYEKINALFESGTDSWPNSHLFKKRPHRKII